MTCSRCQSTTPNSECYVCDEPDREEPDAFQAAKEAEFYEQLTDDAPTP